MQQFCDERVLVVGGGDDPHLTSLNQEIWKMLEEDDDQDSDTLTAGCSGCYTNFTFIWLFLSYSVPQEQIQYFLSGGTGGLDRVFSFVDLGYRFKPCSISTNTTSIPLDSWHIFDLRYSLGLRLGSQNKHIFTTKVGIVG